MNASARHEIVSLTSLRGLLAVWIVLYHFWSDALLLFPALAAFSPVVRVGHMAVPGFFMLSGFVLTYNYAESFHSLRGSECLRFLLLRLARIYPVHFVSLMVVVAMVWVSHVQGYRLTESGYTRRDFVLNLLLVHTWVPGFHLNWNYPSWSISSEWFAYLWFPFGAAAFVRLPLRRWSWFVLCLMACLVSVSIMLAWRPRPFYELVLVIPTFLTGAWLHRATSKHPGGPAAASWRNVPELLLIGLPMSCYIPFEPLVTALVLTGLALLLAVTVHLGEASRGWWSWRPVVFLGEVSYSLYMTHTLAQKLLYRILPARTYGDSALQVRLLLAAAYLCFVAGSCVAMYFGVERPCRGWCKRVLAGR